MCQFMFNLILIFIIPHSSSSLLVALLYCCFEFHTVTNQKNKSFIIIKQLFDLILHSVPFWICKRGRSKQRHSLASFSYHPHPRHGPQQVEKLSAFHVSLQKWDLGQSHLVRGRMHRIQTSVECVSNTALNK